MLKKLIISAILLVVVSGAASALDFSLERKGQQYEKKYFADSKNVHDYLNTKEKAIVIDQIKSASSASYIDSWGAGDLDGDGLEDMLIGIGRENLSLRYLSDNITAVRGSNGTLLWKISKGTEWLDAHRAGNLDGDSKDDVILVNATYDGSRYIVSSISALRGNGSTLWSRNIGRSITGYSEYDFDGDGMGDLLLLYYNPAGDSYDQVFVIKGNSGSVVWSKSGNWNSVYPAGDLNGDGREDVLFHVEYSSLQAVRGDNGALLWTKTNGGDTNTYVLGGVPIRDDVNGDGREDVALAVLNFGSTITSTISMLKGNDASAIWTKTSTSSNSYIEVAWGGDLSGDGIDDVVLYRIRYDSSLDRFFWDKISSVRGNTGSEMWNRTGTDMGFSPVRDLNGDGTRDLLIGDWEYDASRNVYFVTSFSAVNGGNGVNLWSKNKGSYDWIWARAYGDLDGNNKEDVLLFWGSFDRDFYADTLSAVKGYDGSVLWTKNRGAGTWLNTYPIKDVDGDRTDDVILFTVSYDAVYYPSSFCVLKGSDGANIWCRASANTAPGAMIFTPSANSGDIPVTYSLFDNESDLITLVSAEYSLNGTVWYPATMGAGGNGIYNLASSPSGVNHTYVWASNTDLANTESDVYFRLMPNDGTVNGNFAVSSVFHVNNTGYLRGDVNRNGRRDTGDATLILRSIVGLSIPSQYLPVLPTGDMNCNNRIDTGDATLVLRDIVSLPIPKCWE